MSEPIKTHEITTYSGRSWPLTAQEFNSMNERLEAGARFVSAPDAKPPDYVASKINVSDIKFFGKRQMSMGDMVQEQKGLPAGEVKFNPLAKGYIKFLAASIKLAVKPSGMFKGGSVSKITAKLSDEQKPLVNAELAAMGLDYRV